MRDDADPRVGYAWVPRTLEGDRGYLLRPLWVSRASRLRSLPPDL